MEYIKSVILGIYHHFSVMAPLLLILTLVKFSIPFVGYIVLRVFEYRSCQNFMRKFGLPKSEAKSMAKEIWRKPKAKWVKTILAKFRKNTNPTK